MTVFLKHIFLRKKSKQKNTPIIIHVIPASVACFAGIVGNPFVVVAVVLPSCKNINITRHWSTVFQ